MNEIKIRRFQTGDEQSVLELIEKVLTSEFPLEASAYSSEDIQDISNSYGKLGEAFFVAVKNNHIVGTVGIKRDDERTALLRRLFVKAEERKQRLGEKLIDQAVGFAREVGYDELIFKTTSTMKPAVKLGERKGFVPKARINVGPIQLLKFGLNLKKQNLNHH